MKIDNRYARLDPRLFHKQPPEPLSNPIAGHFNAALAEQLDWQFTDAQDWVPILGGQVVPEGFDPLAMAYAGHQFGQWQGHSAMVVDYYSHRSLIKRVNCKTFI